MCSPRRSRATSSRLSARSSRTAIPTRRWRCQNEGRRILHSPELRVNCTCVRVPVLRSHSIALTLRTERKITPREAADAIEAFPGCRVAHDISGRSYPTPVDVSGQDPVWVGRIREDLTDERGLTLWCCGDQILRGAALNAVKIMRLFNATAKLRRGRSIVCGASVPDFSVSPCQCGRMLLKWRLIIVGKFE